MNKGTVAVIVYEFYKNFTTVPQLLDMYRKKGVDISMKEIYNIVSGREHSDISGVTKEQYREYGNLLNDTIWKYYRRRMPHVDIARLVNRHPIYVSKIITERSTRK